MNILSSNTEILDGPKEQEEEREPGRKTVAGERRAVVVVHERYVGVMREGTPGGEAGSGNGCVKEVFSSELWTKEERRPIVFPCISC